MRFALPHFNTSFLMAARVTQVAVLTFCLCQADVAVTKVFTNDFYMGKTMIHDRIPVLLVLLVLHKDVNFLVQQLVGGIVYMVKVQMGK